MTANDLNLDWLISVDDHILEPSHLWVDRVAAKDRERAPHMETVDGMDNWVYDGKRYPSSGLSAVAGKSKEEFSPEPLPYSEMRPGCYDPVARLEDMDQAGILASLCFPTITSWNHLICGWTGWPPRTVTGHHTWRPSTGWTTGSTTASATRARA